MPHQSCVKTSLRCRGLRRSRPRSRRCSLTSSKGLAAAAGAGSEAAGAGNEVCAYMPDAGPALPLQTCSIGRAVLAEVGGWPVPSARLLAVTLAEATRVLSSWSIQASEAAFFLFGAWGVQWLPQFQMQAVAVSSTGLQRPGWQLHIPETARWLSDYRVRLQAEAALRHAEEAEAEAGLVGEGATMTTTRWACC